MVESTLARVLVGETDAMLLDTLSLEYALGAGVRFMTDVDLARIDEVGEDDFLLPLQPLRSSSVSASRDKASSY